jgi:diguanylate cyclase (GGDEF)-like protein/PAS domain S-box-containing protein
MKGFFVLASDITQLAHARSELEAARERLEKALDGSSMALWDADLRTGRVYLSETWAEILGAPRREVVVSVEELGALVHPDDLEGTRRAQLEAMKGARPGYAFEHRVRTARGEWKWILSRGRVTERDPASGRAVRMIGTNVDITDRKRMEEALQSVVHTDPLTGLANRLALADRIRHAMARSRRSGNHLALLYLDIDRFKRINDEMGHAAGDRLLAVFAMRLRACVRASDTVARLGGDEFVVLLDDMKERENAVRVAEKILEETRVPVVLDATQAAITTSIGIAYCDADQNEEELLKRADRALYEAKRSGRDVYRIADSAQRV